MAEPDFPSCENGFFMLCSAAFFGGGAVRQNRGRGEYILGEYPMSVVLCAWLHSNHATLR